MSEAVWNKAFTQGSKALQNRLMKAHAKNPKFQAWLQSSGHGAGQSVKQASKEVKATERSKKLAQQSLKAYGATKGTRMGSEDGSGETLRDTIAPLTRDQHSKVQAAARAAKKTPLTKDQRLSAIAAAARKAKSKYDVPTMEPDDEGHDDLRDVHQSLHIRRGYNEEMEKVDEIRIAGVLAAMDKADKARYTPQVGDNVRTIKMPIPGKVEKIENGKVYFRHESGKLYATHAGNLRKEEFELKEANKSNKENKKEYVRQVGLEAMKQGKVDPARGHSPQRFGREILKGAAADRAVRKAMEKELRRMGEEVKLDETEMKNKINPKDLPFTPDKNPVRRGRGGPMSQAKWLAKQAMMKKMKEMGMKEEVIVEEPKDAADVGEYDYEGDMAKSQLRSIMTNAKRMHDMLEDNTNLPEWVQSKITLAEDYVLTAANYMEGEMNEEVEQIDEGDLSIRTLYNKWADHYTSSEGNSAKRADAVEKAITKVHGPTVMKHLQKAVNANLRGDFDGEERHFEKARTASEKSGSDRVGATVGKDRSKFRKEEVEQEVEQFDEKYMGFEKLVSTIKSKGGARNPAAVAAAIGRKKYGKEKFQAMAAAGKKTANEEVEQIDELKKSTLASYVNKAANQVRAKSGIAASFETQGTRKRNPENKSAYMDVAKDFRQGAKKRLTGIEKATSKLAREALDPVGREDKDIDNDGDTDKTDVYLHSKRKAIGAAIKKKAAEKMGKE